MLLIWSSIDFDEPCPIATMAITAAMPMTMPSVVAAERVTFRAQRLERHAQGFEEV